MAAADTAFHCPSCGLGMTPASEATVCPQCNWRGTALIFNPVDPLVGAAANALPEDATCVHHPTKRAVAVCAGTGDYICSLCAVDLNGEIFSASFIESAGKKKLGKAFEKYLPRPDSEAVLCLAISLFWCIGFITVPWAVVKLVQAFRLRKRDAFYAKVVGRGRLVTLSIVVGLMSAGICIAILLTYAGMHSSAFR